MVTVTGETGPAGDECAGARQEVQLQCDANAMRALAGLPGCCAPAQEGAGRDDRAPTPRPLATACINTSDHAQVRRGEYRDRDRAHDSGPSARSLFACPLLLPRDACPPCLRPPACPCQRRLQLRPPRLLLLLCCRRSTVQRTR